MNYPPGPKGHFLLGSMTEFTRDQLSFLAKAIQEYGDIISFRFSIFRVVILNNPDLIREVLVTESKKYYKPLTTKKVLGRFLGNGLILSDGDFWRRQRRLAQPAFHAKRIEAYAQTMVDQAARLLADWKPGETRDVDHEMMKLTLAIVAKTLFDADVTGEADVIYEALTTIQRISNRQTNSVIPPLPRWIPTPSNRRESQAIEALDSVVVGIINERRAAKEDRGDLLSMLLLAEDEDGERMTDKQVRDEAMTIFLAGHETTANALTWTWYLLSQNPQVEQQLHQELDTVLQGRPPTLADLPRLTYTEKVVKEALRLYPPAWGYGREPVEGVTLGGYMVKKGTPIFIVPYITHRDPRWFPEPERFMPERFDEGYEERIPKYAYMPFGGGPRICIGNSFAMMEAQLLLATIASGYRFSLKPGHRIVPEPLITLRSKFGMPMLVEARSSAPASHPVAQTESA